MNVVIAVAHCRRAHGARIDCKDARFVGFLWEAPRVGELRSSWPAKGASEAFRLRDHAAMLGGEALTDVGIRLQRSDALLKRRMR